MGSPTLKEIAARAGVARSTVSAILGNMPHCYASKETRQRVLDTAQELGYEPNTLSRGLLGQKTFTIGLIARTLIGPTIKIEDIASLELTAQQRGYRLLIASHDSNAQREANLIKSFLGLYVDGLIVEPNHSKENQAIYTRMIKRKMPLVVIDAPHLPAEVAQVRVDRERGGYMQVKHLLDAGRRQFAFIIESLSHPLGQAKVRGHRKALQEAGLEPDDQLWLTTTLAPDRCAWSDVPREGARLIATAMKEGKRFDALVASSDSLAMGAMRAILKAGLRIPEDVAVCGFHDEMFSEMLPISLTSIRHPNDVAQIAFDMLLEQMGKDEGAGSKEPRKRSSTIRTPDLIARESTGFPAPEGDVP
jgi:DNA-binding LacI/PurR family transcriptional regulator